MSQPDVALRRLPAFIIDFIVVFLAAGIISTALEQGGVLKAGSSTSAMMFVAIPLFFFLYWAADLNWGKRLFRLKIVDAKTLEKPTLFQLFRRCILFSLLISFNVLFLIPALVSKKRQSFHDMLAGTRVIKLDDGTK